MRRPEFGIPELEQLVWEQEKEDEHLEFKEAKGDFANKLLAAYCVALANEGGGKLVLGVTDKRPRKIVGTRAAKNPTNTVLMLRKEAGLDVKAQDIAHPHGRVLVFHVGPHPLGKALSYKGSFYKREGESLVGMTSEDIERIAREKHSDYSAEVCPEASMDDLDPNAIERFRRLWMRKSENKNLAALQHEQLLSDAELAGSDGLTYAALILFGTQKALGKYRANAEIVYEYRPDENSIPASERKDYRMGFFLCDTDIVAAVDRRNSVERIQDGLFVREVPMFRPEVIREPILNAITHRDYWRQGSVFIRQYPRTLVVESPGGFPPGITPENVWQKQNPRNRRIAEAFQKCGLVERANQGMKLLFESCIKDSKLPPDFTGTDDYQVSVAFQGQVQDPRFLKFLEKTAQEKQVQIRTEHLIVLDLVCRKRKISRILKPHLDYLIQQQIVESSGRGRGVDYTLSKRLYAYMGEKGVYTRLKGLDRATKKELLLKHIRDNKEKGSRFFEFMQILPNHTRGQIRSLLNELRESGRIHSVGRRKAGRWYPE
jgi:ATP-dependent DNA helicase RecG